MWRKQLNVSVEAERMSRRYGVLPRGRLRTLVEYIE
jgi:hypothetical protein